jgi:hypothetical protein
MPTEFHRSGIAAARRVVALVTLALLCCAQTPPAADVTDCETLSVFDAPPPRSMLLADSNTAVLLNGAYRRVFRYGPARRNPNATLEAAAGFTSVDWWYVREEPSFGVAVYLWPCRGRWLFTVEPPSPNALASPAANCAADSVVVLWTRDGDEAPALPRSLVNTTLRGRGCDKVPESRVEFDVTIARAMHLGRWWYFEPSDTRLADPRWSSAQLNASSSSASGSVAYDLPRNRTRGINVICHAELTCPAVAYPGGSLRARSATRFNTMPVFDLVLPASASNPATVAATVVYCPALDRTTHDGFSAAWVAVSPANASTATVASVFGSPFPLPTAVPVGLTTDGLRAALGRTGRHKRLAATAIVAPGTRGSSPEFIALKGPVAPPLAAIASAFFFYLMYDPVCTQLFDRNSGLLDPSKSAVIAASSLTSAISLSQPSTDGPQCRCGDGNNRWPEATRTESTSLPAAGDSTAGGSERDVPPLPHFWKWLTPAASTRAIAALEAFASTRFATEDEREAALQRLSTSPAELETGGVDSVSMSGVPVPLYDFRGLDDGSDTTPRGGSLLRLGGSLLQLIPDAWPSSPTGMSMRSESGLTGRASASWVADTTASSGGAPLLHLSIDLLSAGMTAVSTDGLSDLQQLTATRVGDWRWPVAVFRVSDGSALIEADAHWAGWSAGACTTTAAAAAAAAVASSSSSSASFDGGPRGLPYGCLTVQRDAEIRAVNPSALAESSPAAALQYAGRLRLPVFGTAERIAVSVVGNATAIDPSGTLRVSVSRAATDWDRELRVRRYWHPARLESGAFRPRAFLVEVLLPPSTTIATAAADGPALAGPFAPTCGCLAVHLNGYPAEHLGPAATNCSDYHVVRILDVGAAAEALMERNEPMTVTVSRACPASTVNRPAAVAAVAVRPLHGALPIRAPRAVLVPRSLLSSAATAPVVHAVAPCSSVYSPASPCSCVGVADGERCAVVAAAGRCFRDVCVKCFADPRAALTEPRIAVQDPTGGWTPLGWSCLNTRPDLLSFADARQACQYVGADLPVVDSIQVRQAVVAASATSASGTSAWTCGISLTGVKSHAFWLDGGGNLTGPPFATLLNVASAPNDPFFPPAASAGAAACVAIRSAGPVMAACTGLGTTLCARRFARPALQANPFPTASLTAGTALGVYGRLASTAEVSGATNAIAPINLTASAVDFSVSIPPRGVITLAAGPQSEAVQFCAAVDALSLCASTSTVYPDNVRLQISLVSSAGVVVRVVGLFTLQRSLCTLVPLSHDTWSIELRSVQVAADRPFCEAIDIVNPLFVSAPGPASHSDCPRDGAWFPFASNVAAGRRRCLLKLPVAATYDDSVARCAARGLALFVVRTDAEAVELLRVAGATAMWAGSHGPAGAGQTAQWYEATVPGLTALKPFTLPSTADRSADPRLVPSSGRCLTIQPLSASNPVAMWSSISCLTPAFAFCSAYVSESATESFEATQTSQVSPSLSEEGTISLLNPSPSDTAEVSQSISATATATYSMSLSLSASTSLQLSESATVSQIVDPGRIVAVDIFDFYDSDLWTEKGVTLQVYLEGGQGFTQATTDDLVALRNIRLTSTLWDDAWGIGIARTIDTLPDDQLLDFVKLSVEPTTRRHINITFRNRPQFALRNTETVYFDFDKLAFNSQVRALGQPLMFRVSPTPVCGPTCLLRHAIRYAALPFLLLNLLLGGDFTYLLDFSSTVILLESDCVQEMSPLPFIVHPLQVPIGGTPYRYYFGAAVCNMALLVAIRLAFEAAIRYLRAKFNYTRHYAEAGAYFPGVYFLPYILLSPGAVTGCISLLSFGEWWEKLIGALLLALLFYLALAFQPVVRTTGLLARFLFNPRTDDEYYDRLDDEAELVRGRREQKRRKRLQRLTRAAVDRAARRAPVAACSFEGLYGVRGVWAATDRERTFVIRLRYVFTDFYNEFYGLGLAGVGILWIKATLLALRPFSFAACVFETGAFAAIELMTACALIYWRPFRRRIHNLLSCVVALCHCCGLMLFFLSLFVIDVVDWTLGCYTLGCGILIFGLVPFLVGKIAAGSRCFQKCTFPTKSPPAMTSRTSRDYMPSRPNTTMSISCAKRRRRNASSNFC